MSIINPKWSEMIDATPPQMNESEAFYSQLRPRAREREIQGPIKLKVHSSLERVYDSLKFRGSIESVYNDTGPTTKMDRYRLS